MIYDRKPGKLTTLRWILILLLGASWLVAGAHPLVAAPPPPIEIRVEQMTVAEKVGQLFIIAFVGRDAGPESEIAQLITEYKIGGVALLSSNSNFYNLSSDPEQRSDADTPMQVATLTNALQELALSEGGPGIPLFVAVDHEGDGYPYTRLRSGFTPLPSAMAIGATWDATNAEHIGEIAGHELSAVGVNMLLGPDIDVLNNPRLSSRGDIGIRAYGGDPYWVGEMGRAYIRGVHRGSQNRVLTVAKHFPGHGGSDRLPDDDVATVDKSFQELRRIELPPFFRVTEVDGTDETATTDALMTSHIRYRGFQGDIRQFTPPISFDSAGMNQLLTLPEFVEWRETGLIVSDSLGVPAVRRYFDPQEQTFPAKQIAKEAFLAGNDVLILSQFDLRNIWTDQVINIKATIDFFASEYRANPAFRQRVDEAVTRILRAKQRLYEDFTPAVVKVPTAQLNESLNTAEALATVARISQDAITLIHPRSGTRLASPRREQTLIIVTDDTLFQDCFDNIPECTKQTVLSPTALGDTMLRLYGPDGADQIAPENIHNLTFSQLRSYLTAPFTEPTTEGEPPIEATSTSTPAPAYIPEPDADAGTLLVQADWILFVMLDMNTQRFEAADAVRVFLDLGPRSYDKQIVAIALNAPYRLDTTEINKLSAYYAAYSKTPAFIEATVRALFGDLTPRGAPPVNIEGIGYDLTEQLAPDPQREIPLVVTEPENPSQVNEFPTTVSVQTGRVLDHNGNIVPDGTQVTFFFEREDGELLAQVTANTVAGIAEASFSVEVGGPVNIRATSVQASSGRPYIVDFRPPTPTPTATFTPTSTPTESPTATPSAVPTVTSVPTPARDIGQSRPSDQGKSPGLPGLVLALVAVVFAGGVGAVLSRATGTEPVHQVRLVLLVVVVGLTGYVIYGSGWLMPAISVQGSPWLAGLIALAFAMAPVLWRVVRPQSTTRGE
ncbi:MAG: glycoside hydrolase family 3 protein [Anaerolineae bacterium]